MHLSVVIPCFDEERRLGASLERLLAFLDEQSYRSEVLVVENGSRDGTLALARAYEKNDARVRVLVEAQAGKGRAVRRGMLEARGAYRLLCDADFSMAPSEIHRFLPPRLENVDVAIASREAPGARRYGEPTYRHVMGRVFNGLVRAVLLPGFQDTQCGFKCVRGEAAKEIFPRQTLTGFSFDVEMLTVAKRLGYRIEEVPIPWHHDADTRVRALSDTFRMVRDVLVVRRNRGRGVYD